MFNNKKCYRTMRDLPLNITLLASAMRYFLNYANVSVMVGENGDSSLSIDGIPIKEVNKYLYEFIFTNILKRNNIKKNILDLRNAINLMLRNFNTIETKLEFLHKIIDPNNPNSYLESYITEEMNIDEIISNVSKEMGDSFIHNEFEWIKEIRKILLEENDKTNSNIWKS